MVDEFCGKASKKGNFSEQMVFRKNSNGKAKLRLHGDIRLVLEGKVKPQDTPKVALSDFLFGLGAGSYSVSDFFGETIVLFHQAFGTTLSEKQEVQTEKAVDSLTSPFLLGLEVLSFPTELLEVERKEYGEILTLLANSCEKGCFFIADCLCSSFYGAYLKRSPLFGENINENKEKYWMNPAPLLQAQTFLFGALVTEKGKNQEGLEKFFYKNPNEKKSSSFLSHTHAAICSGHALATSWEKIEENFLQNHILGVRHFLSHSIIEKGVFAIFEWV